MLRNIIFVFIIIAIFFNISVSAENIHIYINGEIENSKLEPLILDDIIYVKARQMADFFGAEVSWQQSIKTLSINDGKNIIKMMLDSPYIQVNNKSFRSKGTLRLISGDTY